LTDVFVLLLDELEYLLYVLSQPLSILVPDPGYIMVCSEAASGIGLNNVRVSVIKLLSCELAGHLILVVVQVLLEASLELEHLLFL
jgi:hypothetical protein